MGPEDPEGRRAFALNWMLGALRPLRVALCGDPILRDNLTGTGRDRWLDYATLIDIVGTPELGRPVTTVIAAILITRGYNELCSD